MYTKISYRRLKAASGKSDCSASDCSANDTERIVIEGNTDKQVLRFGLEF